VLERVRDELLALPGCGASILEISHRSPQFIAILKSAEQRLRRLLGIGDDYCVLFLQGGSRLQFSMIPMNLFGGVDRPAEYVVTGAWSEKAVEEARREGDVRVVHDGAATNYDRLPEAGSMELRADAAFRYYTSNETIQGVQFGPSPRAAGLAPDSVPIVCDASSDFLCRPTPVGEYGLLYACAQKNAGPAGLTIVILRRDLLARSAADLPGYLNYSAHQAEESMYNTPPTFAIYVLDLVLQWLEETVGGLAAMAKLNERKAKLLYDVIDAHPEIYQGHARRDCRSCMNVTFRVADAAREAEFLKQAKQHDLATLGGHRSVGGVRASIYNAMPEEGVAALAQFMRDFAARG
jgi:phosphoserine aminotransferase